MNKFLTIFCTLFLCTLFITLQCIQCATVDGYNAYTNEKQLENNYDEDWVSQPYAVNPPASQNIQHRQGVPHFQPHSSKSNLLTNFLSVLRRGFAASRQGGALGGLGSSLISLGLGTIGTLGTVAQASQISSLSDSVGEKSSQTGLAAALSRIASLETSVKTLSTDVAALKALTTTGDLGTTFRTQVATHETLTTTGDLGTDFRTSVAAVKAASILTCPVTKALGAANIATITLANAQQATIDTELNKIAGVINSFTDISPSCPTT